VLDYLKNALNHARFIITLTTRPKRPKETDGIDYHFVTREDFDRLSKQNGLLESATVYDNWYGVPKQAVRDVLEKGYDAVVKVDVQGAANIKKIVPEAVFIFLAPPSVEDLKRRLTKRYTESTEQLAIRLAAATNEMKQVECFDYIVVNAEGKLDEAVRQILSILTAEKCRVHPRKIEL